MAFYSLVMYAGNGSNRNFTIHFPYLEKSHVKVKINSVPTTAFTWLTSSSIQFNTAPAAGVNIEICRETPLKYAPVDFTDGSILLEQDLDLLTTFNLYVDQELTDGVARASSAGNQAGNSAGNQAGTQGTAKVSNTDTTSDTLNNKLTVVAPLSKAVKNVGANEKLELSIDLSNYVTKGSTTGGSGSDMSKYATLKANTFDGVQTMTGLKVKVSPNAFVDVQTTSGGSGDKCGVRYFNNDSVVSAGSPKYQSYYTPSDGIFRYTAEDAKAEWRWGIKGHENGMSFKRGIWGTWEGDAADHYVLNVGEYSGMSDAIGGVLNIHGVNSLKQYAKVALHNSGELNGGMLATNYDLILYAAGRVALMNLNSETYFTAWRDHALLTYGTQRNNDMIWQADGNVVLSRNKNVVWNINNQIASDVRLKTDIKPLEGSSLEKVKQLTAKTYLWKDDLMGKGDKREIGLIAQEVAEVVPEVVSKMSSVADTLGVAYTQLVPLLVEAVKELSAKVESLEAQLMSKE